MRQNSIQKISHADCTECGASHEEIIISVIIPAYKSFTIEAKIKII